MRIALASPLFECACKQYPAASDNQDEGRGNRDLQARLRMAVDGEANVCGGSERQREIGRESERARVREREGDRGREGEGEREKRREQPSLRPVFMV